MYLYKIKLIYPPFNGQLSLKFKGYGKNNNSIYRKWNINNISSEFFRFWLIENLAESILVTYITYF